MNSWNAVGRLTKDPELTTTSGGTSICTFTIAVDRRVKSEGQSTADFIPCKVFRKTAEFVAKYFSKGKMIVINNAEIQTRSWEDSNKNKHYITEAIGGTVEFAGDKKSDGKKNDAYSDELDNGVDESEMPY